MKQRTYKTYACKHCNKIYKENAWWRHGIGRCVQEDRPRKFPFSFRFEYQGEKIWYTAWGVDESEAQEKVATLYDNPVIINVVRPSTAVVPPDIKSA
jgi:hypothetical protein